jgi:putative DNA primase/helicase
VTIDQLGCDPFLIVDGEPVVPEPIMPEPLGVLPTTPKPKALSVIVANIPVELKGLRQFVMWRYSWRIDKQGQGKWAKTPRQVSGQFAKSNDPATWTSFDAAQKALPQFDGIGLCFGGDVAGIDFDGCFDEAGNLKPWADDLLCDDGGLAIPTYSEVSPSGSGLHLVYFGKLPERLIGKQFDFASHVGCAFYSDPSNRYFTMTGNLYGEARPVTTIEPGALMPVAFYLESIFPPKPTVPAQPLPQVQPSRADDDIIRIAGRARNADKVIALLRGDIAGYPSQSEADAALCAALAFYTKDPAQIDRIFKRSGLYRPKWDQKHRSNGATYGTVTIERALQLTGGRS